MICHRRPDIAFRLRPGDPSQWMEDCSDGTRVHGSGQRPGSMHMADREPACEFLHRDCRRTFSFPETPAGMAWKQGSGRMNRRRTTAFAIMALFVAAWAYACGDGAVEPPPADPPRPTTVTTNPGTARLASLGTTVQLSAEARYENGNAMTGTTMAWNSSDAAVANVDPSGLVTAVAEGSAAVTVTAGAASGTAAVTVEQVPAEGAVEPAARTLVALGDLVTAAANGPVTVMSAAGSASSSLPSHLDASCSIPESTLATCLRNRDHLTGVPSGQEGGQVAVVVGNGKYQSAVDLPTSATDARAVAELLEDAGFDVMLLVDADASAMRDAGGMVRRANAPGTSRRVLLLRPRPAA